MKKKILLAIPLVAGAVLGEIVFTSPSSPAVFSPEVEVPSGRKETQLAAGVLTNSQLVSDYLLKSQTLFSKAIELSSQNADSSQNERIVQLINEAITAATEAIIANPQDSRGYAQRGKIYKAIEQYLNEALSAALADYQQAVRLNPRQVSYYQEVASLLLRLERKTEALAVLKKCVYINPTEAQGWYELAKLQAELGALKEAKASYQRILALLVDETQKEAVRQEISALDKLLAQADSLPTQPLVTSPPAKEIVFPDEPPKMEAKIASQVIIADPGEEKTQQQQYLSSSNALSGSTVLPAGEKELKIENANLQADSQVYLAAEDDLQNEVLRVKGKGEGWFTVSVSHPLSHDVSFRWWIIPSPK